MDRASAQGCTIRVQSVVTPAEASDAVDANLLQPPGGSPSIDQRDRKPSVSVATDASTYSRQSTVSTSKVSIEEQTENDIMALQALWSLALRIRILAWFMLALSAGLIAAVVSDVSTVPYMPQALCLI